MTCEVKVVNIVLASAFINNDYIFSNYYHKLPTLGIGYIAAVLEKKGYKNVSIIDKTIHINEADELLKEILSKNPDILGFYCVSENYKFILQLLQKVKEKSPKTITVIGGPHIYGLPEASVKPECIDFGIYGEGEQSFLELIESNFNSSRYPSIPGLIYKANNKVHRNSLALVHKLDEIPFPARHLYPPLDRYMPSIVTYKKLPATGMLTSRGCASKCTFCHSGKGELRLRFHSAEYVIEEIKHLQKDFGIKEFFIFDDTFVAHRKRAVQICEDIIRNNLNISWSCNVKVNYLSEDLLRLMKQAGCWLLQVGVESGNQEILNIMKKGITLEQVRSSCEIAYKLGFHIKTFFIIGNAGETEKTIDDTINFMTSLPVHYSSINLMTPLPGTELWDHAEQYGKIDKNKLEEINYLSDKPAFVPYGLTEETLLKKFHEAYLRFYLNPRTIFRNLMVLKNLEDAKRFAKASMLLSRLMLARQFKKAA
ncbi:MAG TPA: B12-binding domain-containing radical SAM protein [Candidatus Tripitaka californicus]|uniref:B12-binding domain-containing radical SAM protein n=1 Tax=Candidatus Tripitaka californicus TaxID=3367616 RepID=UPI0040260ED1